MARKMCPCGAAQAVRPGGLCNKCFGKAAGASMPQDVIESVPLARIRTEGMQARAATSDEAAAEYAETYRAAPEVMPPGRAVKDEHGDYWLYDGLHRYAGAKMARLSEMRLIVIPGTRRDALLLSCGANHGNAVRRTDDDKRNAVRTMLADPEWTTWSTNAIAEACHVSWDLTEKVRKDFTSRAGSDKPDGKRTCADGREMDTAGIGPGKKEPKAAPASRAGRGEEEASSPPAPRPKTPPSREIIDRRGDVVPVNLRDLFADESIGFALSGIEGAALDLKHRIESVIRRSKSFKYMRPGDLALYLQQAEEACKKAEATLEAGRPYAVCPRCKGPGCEHCRQSGSVPEWRYQELAEQPEE